MTSIAASECRPEQAAIVMEQDWHSTDIPGRMFTGLHI
jgi:hypothetical protein